MKKATLFFAITLFAYMQMAAQDTYVQMIQDTAGRHRFQRVEVRQYDNFTDTLVVDRFPDVWLDSAALAPYMERLIASLDERQTELRRLFNMVKSERDVHIGFYDNINGDGAYLALQKSKLLAALSGAWTLVDRNGDTTKHDITVTGNDFRKNATRFGTITVTDDLQVVVTGFYNFDLVFDVLQNGNLKFQRNNNRLFILRR